jgi:hypothetical protein
MKYRAGWGEEAFSPLSIDYCARATAYMDGKGAGPVFSVAGPAIVPAADPYVIAVAPTLKAQKIADYGSFHTRPRTEQDQTSALEARWKAHQRHF